MIDFKLDLTVIPETGLRVGGSGNTGVLADRTIQRDGQNRLIIPASQVKGRLRHACENILRAAGATICRPPHPETTCPQVAEIGQPPCPICAIFGSPWSPSTLRFHDLVYAGDQSAIRPGIGLDRRRRIVKEELLFLSETTLPGLQPAFAREPAISGSLDEEGQAYLLLSGLQLIRQWGGSKSRGLGWANFKVGTTPTLMLDSHGKEVLAQWLQQHIG